MSNGFFDLRIEGQDEIVKLLADFQGRSQAVNRAFPVVGELLIGAVNDVVDMEGPGWPALAPETLARRRLHGRGAQMLRDTGVMMESLEKGYGPEEVWVEFGTPYAVYHINGKRNPFDLAPVEKGLIEDVNEILLGGITG